MTTCTQCHAPTRGVAWVTCGRSECQEADARACLERYRGRAPKGYRRVKLAHELQLLAFVTDVANMSAAEVSDDSYPPRLVEIARALLARVKP